MKRTKSKISSSDIEDRLQQLIFLSEINIECCKTIYSFINRKNKIDYMINLNREETKYLTLAANNHFFESLLKVHTLLHKRKKDNKELSLQLYKKRFFAIL